MKTLTWTWVSKDTDIKIFDGDKLIGRIPDFLPKSKATINGKTFSIHNAEKASEKRIVDPETNQIYCEVRMSENYANHLISETFRYSGQTCFLSSKGLRLIELKIAARVFPKKNGILKIFQEENLELVIFGLFYLNAAYEPDTI